MAKRFTETTIWKEDWFIEMPLECRLFWFFLKDNCDHAGIFKVNLTSFCRLNGVSLTPDVALKHINSDKIRIRVLNSSTWFIEDFFCFQYGTTVNMNNTVHFSILEQLKKNSIKLSSIRGLKGLKDGVKDIDKDSFDLNNLNLYGKKGKQKEPKVSNVQKQAVLSGGFAAADNINGD